MLGPVVLVGVTLGLLAQDMTPRVQASGSGALAMDQLMRDNDPQVVVIGNSLTMQGIHRGVLKKQLGLKGNVVTLAVQGSAAPTWYALLANRVYAEGYRPELVIIANPLSRVLTLDLPGERDRERLEEHMSAHEPVLWRKVFGREDAGGALGRIRVNRMRVRDRILEWVKYGLAPDRDQATADMEEVFGKDGANTDLALYKRVIPVVENEQLEVAQARTTDLANTLVPDLLALAAAHDSRIAFARLPVSTSVRLSWPVPPQDVQRPFVAALNSAGAGYIDLSQTPTIQDSDFRDGLHLSAPGARRLTQELASALLEQGALSDEGFAPAPLPLPAPVVTRHGAGPDLPSLGRPRATRYDCRVRLGLRGLDEISDEWLSAIGAGQASPLEVRVDDRALAGHVSARFMGEGCTGQFFHARAKVLVSLPEGSTDETATFAVGLSEQLPLPVVDRSSVRGSEAQRSTDAWWVYPDTELRLQFSGLDPGPLAVDLSAYALVAPADRISVDVSGETANVQAHGGLVFATHELEQEGRTAEFVVRSPADGPYLLLRSVSLTMDGRATTVLGTHGGTVESWRFLGVQGSPLSHELVASADGSLALGPPVQEADGLQVLPLVDSALAPALAAASVTHRPKAARRRGCTVVSLVGDGQPLDRPAHTISSVRTGPGPAWVHFADGLLVRAQGTPRYTAQLEPDRRCASSWWVYPGDHLALSPKTAAPLIAGGSVLALDAKVVGDAAADQSVRVRLTADDTVRVDTAVALTALSSGTVRLPLEPALAPSPGSLMLEIQSAPGLPFVLLTSAAVELDRTAEP